MVRRKLRVSRPDRGERTTKEKLADAVFIVFVFCGVAYITSPGWLAIGELLWGLIGDPLLFVMSVAAMAATYWNLSYCWDRRRELDVARRIIRMFAERGRSVPLRSGWRERFDEALGEGVRALAAGEPVATVVDGLQRGTGFGERLPEGPRRLYDEAMVRLVDAQRGDQVLGLEDRRREVLEAERLLWKARCEVLRNNR